MVWLPPYSIDHSAGGDSVYVAVLKNENNIAAIYGELQTLTSYRSSDYADILELQTSVSGIVGTTIPALQLADFNLDGRLDSAESTISSHTGTLSTHTSQIGTLISDLDTAEGTISTQGSTISSHTSTLSSHTTSIGTNTSDIGNLTTAVGACVRKASADTISANHEFTGNPIFSGKLYLTTNGWNIYEDDTTHWLSVYFGANAVLAIDDYDGKLWAQAADFGDIVYCDSLDTDNHGTGYVKTRNLDIRYDSDSYCTLTANSYGSLAIAPNGTVAMYVGASEVDTMNVTTKIYNGADGGKLYVDEIHYVHPYVNDWTIDTSAPGNNRWDMLACLVNAYRNHDESLLHTSMMKQSVKTVPIDQVAYDKLGTEAKKDLTLFKEVPIISRSPEDCIQVTAECTADLLKEVVYLRTELEKLKGSPLTQPSIIDKLRG